jgi:tRNA G10  N-methylase Trm11
MTDTSAPVPSAFPWKTNAALIADVARLGYLYGHVLDPTYGEGNWWTAWTPEKLTKHDLDKLDGVDYRNLPHPDGTFDSVAFDPPYVSPGGRATSTIKAMHAAYGMQNTARTPRLLFEDNAAGFAECVRVLKVGGYIVYKSQDYISSGKYQPVTHWIITDALARADLEYVDRFEHRGNSRPQPAGRRQVHARRNHSTLLVFQKVRCDP